jgi:hypothetical protein
MREPLSGIKARIFVMPLCRRTTITLEDDVAAWLKHREKGWRASITICTATSCELGSFKLRLGGLEVFV